jgi:hypothetical protein
MTRLLRHVLIALVLLFSQQAAQVHSMAHLSGELAAAAAGGKSTPPAGHPAEQCLAFHAIDSALPGTAPVPGAHCDGATPVAQFTLPLLLASRVAFDSRAPPALS